MKRSLLCHWDQDQPPGLSREGCHFKMEQAWYHSIGRFRLAYRAQALDGFRLALRAQMTRPWLMIGSFLRYEVDFGYGGRILGLQSCQLLP